MNIVEIFLILQLFVLWLIFALTPSLLPVTEAFGVNLPDIEDAKRLVASLKKRYLVYLALSGLVIFVAFIFVASSADDKMLMAGFIASLIALVVSAAIAYYVSHRRLKRLKATNRWSESLPQVSVTMPEIKKSLVSPWWFLLYVPVMVLSFVVPLMLWDKIPDSIALRYDMSGNPVAFIEKGRGFLLWPVLIEGFLAITMGFVYLTIRFTRVRLNPADPQLSATQQAVFRKRWSAFTVFGGIALCLLFVFFPISAAFRLGFAVQFSVIMLWTFGIVLWAVILALTTGQLGSRVKAAGRDKKEAAQMPDEDKYWKAGVFYFNPDDPSVFVEKRFGVGFTLNWGSKLAWLIMAGFIAFITGFVILVNLITG